ncbi:MAG: SDR family NAD(P)-dependent oxidoreductase [Nanoarchaeota archaeon]|nr:SDR family NAD(P)-dependent oxidoreductase [Nanoarchaeota archaeon]
MENFKDFYKGKKVLVTGADGFMGSHLTEHLFNYGANITVFVRGSILTTPSQMQLKNIDHLKDKIKIISGDIASHDTIELIKKEKPEIIFHLAAEAYVNKSFDQPREVIDANVTGTLNILHSCLTEDMKPASFIKRIVVTSSSEIYGTYNQPIKETFPMNPSSPYGASKVAADRLAYSYYNTYNLPIAIIRPFNTYGPRHTYDAPPKFISLALEGKDITIYGTGEQSRDLMYVDDTINGFLTMGMDKKAIGTAINFGTGKDTKIIDLAKNIIKISNSKSKIIHLPPRKSEVQRLCCDNSKAKELFNWQPQVSIEEGIKNNIEWVINNKK